MKKKNEKAAEIIDQTINSCKKKYWEFTEALSILEPEPFKDGRERSLSTDGEKLFYSEKRVIAEYDKDRYETLSHELMHVILHLVFDDPECYRNTRTKKLYSAYADIRLDIIQFYMEYPKEKREQLFIFHSGPAVNRYYEFCRFMDGPDKLPDSFFELKKNRSLATKIMRRFREQDDHSLWEKQMEKVVVMKWEDIRKQITNAITIPVKRSPDSSSEKPPITIKIDDIDKFMSDAQAMLDIDGMKSKEYGTEAGGHKAKYKADKENNQTYIDILRDFFKEKESSLEDPETIDRMMYSYGFDLYEDVALIEPSEETAKTALGTIAIAIDTSGSCSGPVASKFLREIANLFRDISTTGGFDKILFYQCDCEIQQRKELDDPDEIPQEAEQTLFGWGGTSFIPVFDDLEQYAKENETEIDALFYLTDGWGTYPEEKPGFKTFFILPHEDYMNISDSGIAPKWIDRLEIREEIG